MLTMFIDFIKDNSSKNAVLKNIYFLIHQYGPISRTELLERTKMKKTTLGRTMDELLHKGYILESGIGESSVGRPPTLYQANENCGYLIGIHISRTNTRIVLTDILFNIIEQESFTMTSLHTPSIVLSKLTEKTKEFIKTYDISYSKLLGIGIGAIGPLDTTKGLILNPAHFPAPGWANIPIIDHFKAHFPVKSTLEYGVNMAVFGEHRKGLGMYDNLLYCMSGRELGCGIITEGKLVHNNHLGDISRYGHMIIDVDGEKCFCGKSGCLVTYTSPRTILKEIMEQNNYNDWEKDSFDDLKVEHIIDFLNQGDNTVDEVVNKSAHYLGVGIANLITILNSEFIILNGPLINEYPNYYEKTIESVQKHLDADRKRFIHFSKATLKDNAGATGAAIYMFHSYFDL